MSSSAEMDRAAVPVMQAFSDRLVCAGIEVSESVAEVQAVLAEIHDEEVGRMTEPASTRPADDEPDVWTPGNVTRSTSVPDRHDESEARADR